MEFIYILYNVVVFVLNILRMVFFFLVGVDVLVLFLKRILYDCVIILIFFLIILNVCLKIFINIFMIFFIIVEMSVLSVFMMEEYIFLKLVICDYIYFFILLNWIENVFLNDLVLMFFLNL